MTSDPRAVYWKDRALKAERELAKLKRLHALTLRCAEKLETRGNDEPLAVAAALRREARGVR